MRKIVIVPLCLILSNLIGCSSVSGNVVPKTGPTMEQMYDSMKISEPHHTKKGLKVFKKALKNVEKQTNCNCNKF